MSESVEGEGESKPLSQKRTSGNSTDCASPKKSQRFSELSKTTTDACVVLSATKSVKTSPGFESASQISSRLGGSTADDHQNITGLDANRQPKTLSSSNEPLDLSYKTDGGGSNPELSCVISKSLSISQKAVVTLPRTVSPVVEPTDLSIRTGDGDKNPSQSETPTCKPKEISPRTNYSEQKIDIPCLSPPTTVKEGNALDTLQTAEMPAVASSSNERGAETRTKEIEENIPEGVKTDRMIKATLDSKTMDFIAKNIGKEWSEVAINLGYSFPQIDHLQEKHKDSLYNRNLCMIGSWLQAVEDQGIPNPRRLLAHCIAEVNTELAYKIDTEFKEAEVPKNLDTIIQEIIIGKHQEQKNQQQEEEEQTILYYRGDIHDQFRCTIESWRDLDQYFSETKACKQALRLLKAEGIVNLIGPAGEGKSFISHHIALKYMEEKHYTIIPVSSIEEIEKYCNPKLKQIFVLDDPLGSLFLEKQKLAEWVTKNEKIKNIAQKGLTKFIATIRKSIFQKAGRQIKRTLFSKNCVDLTSEQYQLDKQERENILKRHCANASEDQARFKQVTSFYFPGFPLLCHLLGIDRKSQKEMGSDLDPFTLMLHQIEEIEEEKEQYCALVLTAIFDGAFDPQELDSLTDEEKEKEPCVTKAKKIIKLCGLAPNEENLDMIKKSFEHLKSVYFVEKESEFYFLHDVIFSVVAYHFGKNHLAFILDWCSSTFIQARVRVKGLQTLEAFDGIKPIEIPEKKYSDFAKRLTKDLTDLKHGNVFQNPSIHDTKFQKIWVNQLSVNYNKDRLWEIMSFNKEIEEDADVLLNLKKTLDFAVLSSSPIHWLCKYGMLSMLKQILAKYENPNKMLDNLPGHTKPLHFAAGCGHLELVKYLIKLGQDVNSTSCLEKEQIKQTSVAEYYTGFTPLFYAARENHLEVVEYLLKNGAKANLVRDHGASPMLLTADRGHAEVVKMLIKYGGDPGLCCDHGTSPLILAASENHVETVKVLLRHNVDLNTQKIENGVSAVFFAASRGHYESLELLLDKKADPNLCNKEGLSPLGVAINGGHLKSAELLITHGANIKVCDKNNNSALLLTVKWKYSDISKDESEQDLIRDFIKLLLEKGAICDAVNLEKESPLSLAKSHNDVELVELFKS